MTTAHPRPIGLALVRASEIMGAEPFFHEFIAGVERAVRPTGHSVLLNVLPDHEAELATYRRWSADGEVAGVIIVDLQVDDARPAVVRELALPAVVVGPPSAATGSRAVWTGDDDAMRSAVGFLVELGHRRIAHVAGPTHLLHTRIRQDAFAEECAVRGLEAVRASGDYSRASGARALEALLAVDERPTAVVFDSDLMALGGLDSARDLGIDVPGELSLLAWDDSAQCQLSEPPLSAVSHDVQVVGMIAGRQLLEEISRPEARAVTSPAVVIVARGSTIRRSA
ncbi:DNA-binding LacI/PurR family transcriptional regulator [Clavibacter michiganensis]|uniref:LacI family DNA-binding transcriptional regulator n=1 Tax=Clavibacter michiganensis TaxID=28447 RepID=UPI001AE1203E|nr:substrate-binding domain-containing protein [Clavibacter michiganensis]MBP2459073.1 DNA-binding LacI/PurR family transcriptional regulator [Clavibacter michiganensis]MDQ0411645.1 DNA-binding LacI/PurR family transcriptional regulator [Clavibacter michiganensis]